MNSSSWQVKAAEVYGKAGDQIAMLPKDALTKLLVNQAINALNAVSATLERLKTEILDLVPNCLSSL